MISASTEPSSSSRRASSMNTTDSTATRLFCGGKSPSTCAAQPTQSVHKYQGGGKPNHGAARTVGSLRSPSRARRGSAPWAPDQGGGRRRRTGPSIREGTPPWCACSWAPEEGATWRRRQCWFEWGFWGLGFHGSCRGQRKRSRTGGGGDEEREEDGDGGGAVCARTRCVCFRGFFFFFEKGLVYFKKKLQNRNNSNFVCIW